MAATGDNKIVHGLWIGRRLSKVELLTIRSFIHHGHEFHLWLYDNLEHDPPVEAVIRDANEILPAKKIYRRRHNDPKSGVGKGSVGSPFADLFRYKLLHRHGGWWSDMDMTCLKPLDFKDDYVFREHDKISVIGNLLKVPPCSELMKITSEQVESSCDENTVDWLLPNRLLSENIRKLHLTMYIKKNISNPDIWQVTEKFIFKNRAIPKEWHVMHWMNEEWRMRNISKDDIRPATAIGSLMYRHGLGRKSGYADKVLEKIKRVCR